MSKKLDTFKGTRDIWGEDKLFRDQVIQTIKSVYESWGYTPLDTPIIERPETLLGKYGDEAEDLLFMLADPYQGGLRYDHTVPLARFAQTHWQHLQTPFKRYALGPVFRGENTQRGRYRQFDQCDIDILGSESILADAEIVAINAYVMEALGFTDTFTIQINDRRLITAIFHSRGISDKNHAHVLRGWDKLDKQSVDEVISYISKNYDGDIAEVEKLTKELLSKDNKLEYVKDLLKGTQAKEFEEILETIYKFGVDQKKIVYNPLLARGLSYYTGTIFETIVHSESIGSLGGGGRYDTLIKKMGGPDVAAIGSSIGIDRLVDVMKALSLRPKTEKRESVLVTIFDSSDDARDSSLGVFLKLKKAHINAEIYQGKKLKIGEQISYANKKNISHVVIIGPDEADKGEVALKNLATGDQEIIVDSELIKKFRKG